MTGTLAIELGQFGQDNMVITGTATLAGTLNVNFLDAGDDGPPLGMEIWLLRYGDHSGTFTTVNLPEMIGKDWELSYEANGLKATVVEGDFFIYIPIVLNQP